MQTWLKLECSKLDYRINQKRTQNLWLNTLPPKRKKTICVGYLISWCWVDGSPRPPGTKKTHWYPQAPSSILPCLLLGLLCSPTSLCLKMFIPRCSPIFIPSPIVYIPMFIWIHLLPGNHSLWEMMSIPSNKNSWSPWIARSRGSYGAAVELGASWPCQWRAAPMEKWINRRTYRQTDRKAHSQRGRQTNRSDICVCVSGWKTQDPENKTMVEHRRDRGTAPSKLQMLTAGLWALPAANPLSGWTLNILQP